MYKYLLVVICLSITVLSCQKEISLEDGAVPVNNGGGNAQLVGVWKLAGMQVETFSENEIDLFGTLLRSVTTSVYNTKSNTGTFNFTSDFKAITTNVGYSIDTVAMVYIYEDNILQDSSEYPFDQPYSSSTSTSGYKLIGADSIYFTGGFITIANSDTTTQNTRPAGMKYKIAGSTLTMTFNNGTDSTLDMGGQTVKIKQRFSGTVTLVK